MTRENTPRSRTKTTRASLRDDLSVYGDALLFCAKVCGSPKLVDTNSDFSAKRVHELADLSAYNPSAFPCLAPMSANQQHRGRLTSKKLRVVKEAQISNRVSARAMI